MKVAIIGGGVIGAGIAWRLAQRGADVVVIGDRTRPGVASIAAGGMLAPLAEAPHGGAYFALGLESLRRWPSFAAELESTTGHAIGYTAAGKLVAALSAAEAEALAATYTAASEGVELIDGAAARRLEPSLSPDARAAIVIRDDHRVDNVAMHAALERAATLAGARFVAARATAIGSRAGRATGVVAGDRTFDADVIVLAAGAWSGAIEGLPRPLPVRPVRGQMLALRPASPLFTRTLASAHAYMVPRPDGRVIVGSTMEEVGFDATTTPDALAGLRHAALRLVPALADAAHGGAWAGLRPATTDGLPVLGPDPELHGLVYATGHFRNGILLTPITADAIAAAVTGGDDVDVASFSPARFAARADDASNATASAHADAPSQLDRTCDLCGAQMYAVHCKLICPACGYKRDCSDLW
ncbi:MAG TPA: glycine oxidase ThiO [Longimicrobiales bacterium]